jgi:hypothetical protein
VSLFTPLSLGHTSYVGRYAAIQSLSTKPLLCASACLVNKYSMPARMWQYGIHSFLKLFRKHLPNSIEYMRQFIDLAYQMLKELYRKITAFEETWIECLGDLGRY